jgi:uncharacterized protein (DUF4213/DUF364 family)
MGIIDRLIADLPQEPIAVREVVVGIRWTAVTSRGCGLAASLAFTGNAHPNAIPGAGRLHLKSVQELSRGLLTENPLEASIGLAAYCSTLSPKQSSMIELNAFDLLASLGADKKVVMVGHFPQAEWLAARVGRLSILEKNPRPGDYPAEAAPDLIPTADVVAITGMTLLNHTADGLLELCPPSARVVMLGPSTPLTPVLFDLGVDFISGTAVTDEREVLLTLMQGGSAAQSRGTRKLTLCREPFTGELPATNLSHGRIST